MDPKRYPLAALVEASGLSEATLGRRVGLSGSTLVRARRWGLVETAADRYACRIGLVPWMVWPDWLDELERTCADESCGGVFIPNRGNQRYCCAAHASRASNREYARRRYASDPHYRAGWQAKNRAYRAVSRNARLARQRAYYHENQDELRAKKRAYYEANRELVLERQRDRRARAKAAA